MTPDIPVLPPLPSWHKMRVFVLLGVWTIAGALLPAATTMWDDWYHNEFTDWPKLQRTSGITAGMAALAYWRKYRAWLLAPPGTEIVKTTVAQMAAAPTEGGVTTVTTETVDLQPKEPKA